MTLKDYTNFVANSGKLEPVKLGFELGRLLGPKFPEFADTLAEKRQSIPTTPLHKIISREPELFLETLAEFCEPLIERAAAAEKPEGGQDAAKV